MPFPSEVFNERVREQGHEVIWVMRAQENITSVERRTWDGAPVYLLPANAYNPQRAVLQRWLGNIDLHPVQTIITDHAPIDAIYVRNDLAMGTVASGISRSMGIPYIHRISHLKAETSIQLAKQGNVDNQVVEYAKGVLGKRLRKRVCSETDLVLPISDAMEKYLRNQGYTTKMATIPTGVDCEQTPPDSPETFFEQFDIPRTKPVLLYMGSLNPVRRPKFILDVLQTVNKTMDTTLVILGGRDERRITELGSYAQDLGIRDSVVFTGWISEQETINRAIMSSDIGLSPLPPDVPSMYYSSPVKVNEYLRFKTPVVASDIPDHRTIIGESGAGKCVKYGIDDFADTIRELITTDLTEMGEIGQEYINKNRNYNWLAKQILTSCDQLVKSEEAKN